MGGAIGLWVTAADGLKKITNIMGDIALMLAVYGIVLLAGVVFKKKLAPIINMVMTWIVIPTWIAYLFMAAQGF